MVFATTTKSLGCTSMQPAFLHSLTAPSQRTHNVPDIALFLEPRKTRNNCCSSLLSLLAISANAALTTAVRSARDLAVDGPKSVNIVYSFATSITSFEQLRFTSPRQAGVGDNSNPCAPKRSLIRESCFWTWLRDSLSAFVATTTTGKP